MNVVKRNGSLVVFDQDKIKKAIGKAFIETNDDVARLNNLVELITETVHFKFNTDPSVEDVQDIIECTLMNEGFDKAAKAYILYRHERARFRTNNGKFFDAVEMVDKYLNESDWRVNENANMGYSLQGLNNYIVSNISSLYWLNKIYPKHIKEAHMNGYVHIHDAGSISNYCCGWDLQDFLMKLL